MTLLWLKKRFKERPDPEKFSGCAKDTDVRVERHCIFGIGVLLKPACFSVLQPWFVKRYNYSLQMLLRSGNSRVISEVANALQVGNDRPRFVSNQGWDFWNVIHLTGLLASSHPLDGAGARRVFVSSMPLTSPVYTWFIHSESCGQSFWGHSAIPPNARPGCFSFQPCSPDSESYSGVLTSNSRGGPWLRLGGGCGARLGVGAIPWCYCWVPWWGATVPFSTLIWICSIVCLPLLDTGSYSVITVITLKTQKMVYASWGLCWNNLIDLTVSSLSSVNLQVKRQWISWRHRCIWTFVVLAASADLFFVNHSAMCCKALFYESSQIKYRSQMSLR